MRRTNGSWIRLAWGGLAAIALAAVVGCGGGGGSTDSTTAAADASTTSGGPPTTTALGTLRVALTDNPACGYDNAWVTVEKVRVHRSSSAGDGDAGWIDIPLPSVQPLPTPLPAPDPLRVDLLTLTNGVLVPLGHVQLPPGTYTQMRLVLAENTAGHPPANAVKPTGGSVVPLTTPSAQQSGLKMKVDITVQAGQEVAFVIDFDACKSIVTAGKSGKILLKPVLSVIPLLFDPRGQAIQGWLDSSLAAPGTMVSVQVNGTVARATPPLSDGRFVLYPVPVGTYDLVVTSSDRVTAVVTGVPARASEWTTVNGKDFPIKPPESTRLPVGGQVSVGLSVVDTGGVVRALQKLQTPSIVGPTVEVANVNADPEDGKYGMRLPTGSPVMAEFKVDAGNLDFAAMVPSAGQYLLSATVARSNEVIIEKVKLDKDAVVQDFHFKAP